jgi:hypothetical protein
MTVLAWAVGRNFRSDTVVPVVRLTKASREAGLPLRRPPASSSFFQSHLIFSGCPKGLKLRDLGRKPSLAI